MALEHEHVVDSAPECGGEGIVVGLLGSGLWALGRGPWAVGRRP